MMACESTIKKTTTISLNSFFHLSFVVVCLNPMHHHLLTFQLKKGKRAENIQGRDAGGGKQTPFTALSVPEPSQCISPDAAVH